MSQITDNKQYIPAPPIVRYPKTALSILDVQDGDGHLVNTGVTYLATASTHNRDVVYADDTILTSEDKAINEDFSLVDGFGFPIYRREDLPLYLVTEAELTTLAGDRFELWESFDVETHMVTYMDAHGTDLGNLGVNPEDGFAMLMAAIAQVYQGVPYVLAGRGPTVRLMRDGIVEQAGGVLVPGSGFGLGAESGLARVYISGQPHLWRSALINEVYPTPTKNRADALVEREYWCTFDGPIFYADVQIATIEGS